MKDYEGVCAHVLESVSASGDHPASHELHRVSIARCQAHHKRTQTVDKGVQHAYELVLRHTMEKVSVGLERAEGVVTYLLVQSEGVVALPCMSFQRRECLVCCGISDARTHPPGVHDIRQ